LGLSKEKQKDNENQFYKNKFYDQKQNQENNNSNNNPYQQKNMFPYMIPPMFFHQQVK
jgi:hypothetical protein